MKVTNQDVHGMFRRFLTAIDGKEAGRFDDHGMYSLDHNPTYGGYKIEQIELDSTGVSYPFVNIRLSAREMYYALLMACTAIDHTKKDYYNE